MKTVVQFDSTETILRLRRQMQPSEIVLKPPEPVCILWLPPPFK